VSTAAKMMNPSQNPFKLSEECVRIYKRDSDAIVVVPFLYLETRFHSPRTQQKAPKFLDLFTQKVSILGRELFAEADFLLDLSRIF
jgi:hypothetical protein